MVYKCYAAGRGTSGKGGSWAAGQRAKGRVNPSLCRPEEVAMVPSCYILDTNGA